MSAENGWLVERPIRGAPPQWLTLAHSTQSNRLLWTGTAAQALRFARKQDAEAFMAWIVAVHSYDPPLFVSEHFWDDAPAPQAQLDNLQSALEADILNMSDAEVLREAREDGVDTMAVGKEWRDRIKTLVLQHRRDGPRVRVRYAN